MTTTAVDVALLTTGILHGWRPRRRRLLAKPENKTTPTTMMMMTGTVSPMLIPEKLVDGGEEVGAA